MDGFNVYCDGWIYLLYREPALEDAWSFSRDGAQSKTIWVVQSEVT